MPDFAAWLDPPRVRDAQADALGHHSARKYVRSPDWICEIVQHETAELIRMSKLRMYARAGVTAAWLLDPSTMTLEVYQAQHGEMTCTASLRGREMATVPPFTDVSIDLGKCWPSPAQWESALQDAVSAVGDEISGLCARGRPDVELLRALVALLPFDIDYRVSEAMERNRRILRAWTYLQKRVNVKQALSLARLEIAAEIAQSREVTPMEMRAIHNDHLHERLAEGIRDAKEGNVISEAELFRLLKRKVRRPTRPDKPPLCVEVEAEAAEYEATGRLPPSLVDRVLYGPGTHYVPRAIWPRVVADVLDSAGIQASAVDTALGSRIARLCALADGVWEVYGGVEESDQRGYDPNANRWDCNEYQKQPRQPREHRAPPPNSPLLHFGRKIRAT